MKKFGMVIVGGAAIGVVYALNIASIICTCSGMYNAWEILETNGFHEASEYLNSRIENETARAWMDKSIAEYKKSLHQA